MLTFENDTNGEKLEVHSDIEGLKYLRSVIDSLIIQCQKVGNDHVHLMTKEWGGSEYGLSSESQHRDNQLFNHVKIICWHHESNS